MIDIIKQEGLYQNKVTLSLASIHNCKMAYWKPSSGRSQETECYKRLVFKQFVQVSGLCGPQFLSCLPKRFKHLCRALYGDAILVHPFCCTNMATGNQQKHLELTFSIKALSFHSRTSIRAHKHIF